MWCISIHWTLFICVTQSSENCEQVLGALPWLAEVTNGTSREMLNNARAQRGHMIPFSFTRGERLNETDRKSLSYASRRGRTLNYIASTGRRYSSEWRSAELRQHSLDLLAGFPPLVEVQWRRTLNVQQLPPLWISVTTLPISHLLSSFVSP